MSQTSPESTPPASDAGRWNERYAQDAFVFGEQPNVWLRAHAHHWRAGDRVLCVADGEGRNSVWLAQQGLRVDAFDISSVGVAKARRLSARHGVQIDFQVEDCDRFAWPRDTYDGIAAIFVQFATPTMRKRMFERIVASLVPGGVLVLHGYSPRQLVHRTGGPPQLDHLYTEDLLREAFGAMEILDLSDYEAELDEGAGHMGRSAVIGLVARKR